MSAVPDAVVACNGCTLCCRSRELIPVTAADVASGFPYQTVKVDVGVGQTLRALAQKPDGSCVYVTDAGCSIHRSAPRICRVFDCAGYYEITPPARRRELSQGDAYAQALFAQGRKLHRLKLGLSP